mgnify:CR=1 FL=1
MQRKLEVRGDVGDFLDSVIRTSRPCTQSRRVMDTLNPFSVKVQLPHPRPRPL